MFVENIISRFLENEREWKRFVGNKTVVWKVLELERRDFG